MKRKLVYIIYPTLIFLAFFISSCNSPQKEKEEEVTIEVEIEEGIEEFRSDIDELDPNDPNFRVEIEREVNDFDEKMEEWGEEIEETGDEVSEETREAYYNMRRELDEMSSKIDRWANATDEELENWGDDIKEEFNEFRNSVREWVE